MIVANAPAETVVAFEDKTEMHLNPTISACWTDAGRQRKIESAGNDERYQIFGSVDYRSGDLVYNQEDRKRAVEFISHLEAVLAKWQDRPIVMITDNYSVHKTKAVRAFEREHVGRLLIVYLPTYSPGLNPIEMLWRNIRRLVTHNYKFDSLSAVKDAVKHTLETLADQTDRVLSIVGGIPPPSQETT